MLPFVSRYTLCFFLTPFYSYLKRLDKCLRFATSFSIRYTFLLVTTIMTMIESSVAHSRYSLSSRSFVPSFLPTHTPSLPCMTLCTSSTYTLSYLPTNQLLPSVRYLFSSKYQTYVRFTRNRLFSFHSTFISFTSFHYIRPFLIFFIKNFCLM